MKRTWTDDQLIEAVKNSKTKIEILRKLSLAEVSSNYNTITRRIQYLNLDTSHLRRGRRNNKYPKELLEAVVKDSINWSDFMRKLGFEAPSGSSRKLLINKVKEFNIDFSHFKKGNNNNKRKIPKNKKHFSQILVDGCKRRKGSKQLTRALIEYGKEHKCEECGLKDNWNNKKLVLHVDHINGDWSNNKPENLRFLCPNCHSQTDTFGTRNANYVKTYNNCLICEVRINKKAKHCLRCFNKHINPHNQKNKINWPSIEELIEKVKKASYLAVAKELGVSDNAVRKHIKSKTGNVIKNKYSHNK